MPVNYFILFLAYKTQNIEYRIRNIEKEKIISNVLEYLI